WDERPCTNRKVEPGMAAERPDACSRALQCTVGRMLSSVSSRERPFSEEKYDWRVNTFDADEYVSCSANGR
ncbi:MAG: hypothetical protein RMM98_16200, partial [Acidobacteriota bacterium]|nr:hypothetical protein [Acidobacteriota bacterium]